MCKRESVCVTASVSVKKNTCVCERVGMIESVCERESVCDSEYVCVREREYVFESLSVCLRENVCEDKREKENIELRKHKNIECEYNMKSFATVAESRGGPELYNGGDFRQTLVCSSKL